VRLCDWRLISCRLKLSLLNAGKWVRSMKVKELRELTDAELGKNLDDSKDELFKLRFQMATGQLDNPMKLQEVRRKIARVKTIIRERELGIQRA